MIKIQHMFKLLAKFFDLNHRVVSETSNRDNDDVEQIRVLIADLPLAPKKGDMVSVSVAVRRLISDESY